jgi:hypothetical protein
LVSRNSIVNFTDRKRELQLTLAILFQDALLDVDLGALVKDPATYMQDFILDSGIAALKIVGNKAIEEGERLGKRF